MCQPEERVTLLSQQDADFHSDPNDSPVDPPCCGALFLCCRAAFAPFLSFISPLSPSIESRTLSTPSSDPTQQSRPRVSSPLGGVGSFAPPRSRHARSPLSPSTAQALSPSLLGSGPLAQHGGVVCAPLSPGESDAVPASRTVRTKSPTASLHTGGGHVAALLSAMEADRAPLRSLEQLVALLDRCADYLPVRVEAEEDHLQQRAASSAPLPVCRVCLQVFGPVRPTPHAALLGLLEDILFEDLVVECLSVTSVHFADLSFSCDAVGVPDSAAGRVGSNGFLDVLPTLREEVAAEPMVSESHERVRAFAKNLLECASAAETVHLTRCSFTPSDLGRGLKLPILRLRRLLFEKCPLSPAHIDAFVRLARAENRRSGGVRALHHLTELQLSGALSEDAVDSILSYFDEDLLDGEMTLGILRLPSLWMRVVRAHPLLEHNPSLLVVGT